MTKAQLEKIGIYKDYKDGLYYTYIKSIGTLYIKLPKNPTIVNIIEEFFEEGVTQGKIEGRKEKINEIRRILNLEEDETTG